MASLGMAEGETADVLTARRTLLYRDDGFRPFAAHAAVSRAPVEGQDLSAEVEADVADPAGGAGARSTRARMPRA